MHVDLAVRDSKALEQFLADLQDPTSPTYHQWTTPTEFAARFGPSSADVARVAAYLKSNGFQVNSADSVTRGIDFTGSVAQAEHTFAVRIGVTHDGLSYANLEDPTLPADLAPVINAIEGLDNLVHAAPAVAIANRADGALESPDVVIGNSGAHFGPPDIYNFYNETPLAGTLDGTGTQCIALIEDSSFQLDSANAFNSEFNLPQFTSSNLTVEAVDPNPNVNGNQTETLVDLNYAHTTAPGAPIKVYLGNEATASSGSGLIDALKAAVRENQCSSIVLSFGFCGVPASFYKSVNSMFAQAAGDGQAVFVAAGDDGANGLIFKKKSNSCAIAPTGKHPSEVATSPNVTAVGGTQFTPNYVSGIDSGDVPESAWNEGGGPFGGATGGGRSKIFGKPGFQANVMRKDKTRDYPDIAFGAGGTNPGFFISVPSEAAVGCCVAGTSVGTPSWAGISQLIAERTNGRLGNIDFRLYGMASSGGQPAGIRDVTTGSNGLGSVKGYSAGPGFDLTTGWGTPDIATFVNAF